MVLIDRVFFLHGRFVRYMFLFKNRYKESKSV